MHLVMDREVSGSNPGGGKCFSTRLSFESRPSDISRFMFDFAPCAITKAGIDHISQEFLFN